ncbi:MAG TPA: hypothetical protein VK307_08355 [Thermoleophilaceae bacterium]|nr:hypothetical protein [Thermoleophilaceae bacterium]
MQGTTKAMPAVRHLTALLIAALAALLAVPPAASAAPVASREQRQEMFGLGGWLWPTDQEIATLSARGLRSWRVTFPWSDVEPQRGRHDWGYDGLLLKLARHGVEATLTLTECPDWACNYAGPPRTAAARAAWVDFVRAVVRRYGPSGSLWRQHPEVRARPVVYWQVLNEVNGPDQWGAPPSAAGYAAFLKLTASAIRGADPQAKVVLAGLPEKMAAWLRDYLPALYVQPGFARDFDVMAVGGYARQPRDLRRILRVTRRTMGRNGDAAKRVWITEISWATGGPSHPFVTSERGQAKRLRRAYDLLLACHRRWNLGRVYWFSHRDKRPPPGVPDYWGFHNGLMGTDGRWKPAMSTFLRYVRERPLRVRAAGCRR